MARRVVRFAVVASLLALAVARGAAAQIQLPEENDFHNTTYVGDEPEAARLVFYRAEEHRKAGRSKEAGREVLKLLRGSTRGRVRFGERLVVPVETSAALFLLSLPESVRAELAAEEAPLQPPPPRDLDLVKLRDFAARHPLSPIAAAAWLDAGTLALLAGDAASAAADLERVVHWPTAFSGTAEPLAAVRALAAARLLQAQSRLGERPIGGPLAHWPPGESAVPHGSRNATFAELLSAAAGATLPREAGGATLLGDDARAARPAFGNGRPQPLFTLRHFAPGDAIQEPEFALHRLRFTLPTELRGPGEDLELKELPFRAPLVLGERFVTIEREAPVDVAPASIHVRSVADGHDLFAPIRSDFDLHLDPSESMVVLDRAALSARGEKLFVTFELREPGQSLSELVRSGESARSALFGLDLAREGFVEFGVTSDDLAADPELAGYVFAGPPVWQGGRVLVAASRLVGKETECALLAFDARSGAAAGHVLLARASSVPRVGDRFVEEETRRVNPSPAALRDGTAYVCTNLGVIAAVRAADLELEWLFRYHRVDPPDSERYERPALFYLPPWIGRAPVALADRVLATPSDSLYLYSLARWPNARGDLLLNDPIEKQARMCWLGADEKQCWFLKRIGVLGGASYLVEATDHSGSFLWATPPLSGKVTGVPALSSRHLFLPTDHCIYRLDLERDGFADLAIPPPASVGLPFPEFGTFGDLAVSERCLVSTSQLFTLAFHAAPE